MAACATSVPRMRRQYRTSPSPGGRYSSLRYGSTGHRSSIRYGSTGHRSSLRYGSTDLGALFASTRVVLCGVWYQHSSIAYISTAYACGQLVPA
eukprot:1680796-Rhodomonas_salina.3